MYKNVKFTKSSLLLFLLVCVLIISGCSSENPTTGSESKSQDNKEKYTFKVSFVAAETHSAAVSLKEKMERLEEMSNGRIEVELYPNGVLYGNEREAIEAVQLGNVDITISTSATLASFNPKFMLFDLPFIFKDAKQAYEILDGELGNEILKGLESINLIGLGYQENGFRHIINNKRPVTSPDDVKGLKIRVLGSPVYQDTFKLLGANASPLAFGELYSALQQGTFDGMENPIGLIKDNKFYEVQKYLTLTGQVYAPVIPIMNKNTFEKMPEDLQKVFKEWMLEVNNRQREINQSEEVEVLEMLKTEMEVTELTEEQIKTFKEAVMPVYDQYTEQLGEELINKVKTIAE